MRSAYLPTDTTMRSSKKAGPVTCISVSLLQALVPFRSSSKVESPQKPERAQCCSLIFVHCLSHELLSGTNWDAS